MSASAETSDSSTVSPFEIITTVGLLKPFIEEALTLVDEAKIFVEENSLQIREADAANVGMVDVSLDTSIFDSYNGQSHQDLVLGIDLEQFRDVLSQGDHDDTIHLVLDPKTRKLTASFNDSLEFTIALLDPDTIRESPDLPDMDLDGRAELKGRQLNRAIRAADMVSDYLKIGFPDAGGEFYFDAEGDTDDMHLNLSDDDDEVEEVSGGNEEMYSIYSLDYLKDLKANMGPKDDITMLLGDEFPVKFHVDKPDNDALDVTYMLAPRIETD